MRIEAPHPFSDYRAYKVFHKKQGRWQVCLINNLDGKRTTLLYSKFLFSIVHGRILTKEEEVDHKDGNKLNDSIDNFEIVSRGVNRQRQTDLNPEKVVTIPCNYCGKMFTRPRRQTKCVKTGQVNDYCSRRCNGTMQLVVGR